MGQKHICTVLYKLFHAAFALLWAVLLVRCVLSWQHNGKAALVVALLLSGLLLFVWRRVAPQLDAMPAAKFRLFYGVGAAAFLAAILLLGNLMAESLISDMGVVYGTIPEFLANGHPVENNDYYIICNNNLGLALVLALFYRIVGVVGIQPDQGAGIVAGISLNAAMIWLAVLLLCAALRVMTHRQSLQMALLAAGAVFAPFYLWTPYFYSDTLCLPFLAASILLYALYRSEPRWWLGVALGAVIMIGAAIKGSLAVLAVAATIALAVEHPGGTKQAMRTGVAVTLSFVVLWGGYHLWQQSYLDWTDKEDVCYPTELWLCYGSHDTGDYNEQDRADCALQPGLALRTELMRTRIVENYRARTPLGNLDFMLRKAVTTWGDGEYGAAEYVATPLHSNFTAWFTLYGQPGFMPLVYYCQSILYLLMALMAVGALLEAGNSQQDGGFFARLGLFGAMLFLSFWETKARYGFHFSPVFLLCGVLALDALSSKIGSWGKKANHNEDGPTQPGRQTVEKQEQTV